MDTPEIARRTPPEALFAVGAISQYLGAAVAVGLFDEIAPAGVAWLRVLGAGLIVSAWRRPWRRSWTRTELGWAAAFGTTLAAMNLFFYLAINELPLGNAVAIEFIGPIAVAAYGARNRRSIAAVLLALMGVVLLAGVEAGGEMIGVLFALLAGIAWAGYIVLGHRVARTGLAVDGLGVGMLMGACLLSVVGVPELGPALDSPYLLVLALTTGLLSNAIPYAIDQEVLKTVDQYRFAMFQSMLPASATLIGLVALAQIPSGAELAGIGLVVAALAIQGSARTGAEPHPPPVAP
ncbi:MAG: EamA family transporter [Acidimicrobiales bacterium]